jgi:hypothetical protein
MSTTGNLQSPEIANSRVSGNNGAAHLALAARLGLTNTTYRRHFPKLTKQVSAARTDPGAPEGTRPGPSPLDTLVARNSKLRRNNRSLTSNLRLAAAQIQRLALDNAQLREALETSKNITRIDKTQGREVRR